MSGGISISWQHESLCPMYGLGVVVNSATLANARSLWFNVGALNHLHTTWSLGQGVVFSRAVFLYCDLLRLSFDWVFCCPFSKGFLCELSQLTNPDLGFSAPVWARAARPAGLMNSMFLQNIRGFYPCSAETIPGLGSIFATPFFTQLSPKYYHFWWYSI